MRAASGTGRRQETHIGYGTAALLRSDPDAYDTGPFAAFRRQAAVTWPLIAALAAAGLAVGWGLRTVVFRLAVPVDEPPARACPACGQEILAADGRPGPARSAARLSQAALCRPALSPVSRCRACRARIGPPPLATELVTAALFGLLAAWVRPGLVLAAACWLAACAVALAWIDAAVQRLPDVLTALAYAGTEVFLLLAAAVSGHWGDLGRAALGGLALAAAYLAFAMISRSALGFGDVKLAGSLGTLLAWFGWRTLIAGTVAGFLLGGLVGIGLLLARRATRQQRIPFGPFMIAGAFLAILITAAAGA
jgi:leader peptidase (prepilin peptidase)/N-methyltransferase